MKDRYLFRGKDLYTKEWRIGFYNWCEGNSFINVHTHYCSEPETNSWENTLKSYEVDPKTIGQCTGLKDKNGVLIFEGDKLRIFYERGGHRFDCEYKVSISYAGVLFKCIGLSWECYGHNQYPIHSNLDNRYICDRWSEYENCVLNLCFKDDYSPIKDIEIIGNIHDEN